MSNTFLLPFTTCDRCGMRFPKAKPKGLSEKCAERGRCAEPGCGRTFTMQGDVTGGAGRNTVAVWGASQ